jgi:xanthine dehydrogenase accessory factor
MVDSVLDALQGAIGSGSPVVLATVIEVKGAAPARTGFKLLAHTDGTYTGNVGGGALEQQVHCDAAALLARGAPRLAHYRLTETGPDALGMLCGGEVTVFLEPYRPQPVLIIVGGGHIGRPLAELGKIVGYEVQTVDVRPERADRVQFDPATVTGNSFIVLITEDHVTDEATLRRGLETPAPYIGMIGSLRKVGIVLHHLRADGYTDEALARVRAPIGLDLGGREPGEIALSILAEIESVRHGGRAAPRSAAKSVDTDQA